MNKIFIVFFVSVFFLSGVAEAASISKRVRSLETKVKKQNQKIKQQSVSQQKLIKKIDKSTQEINDLRFKIEKLLNNKKAKKQTHFNADTRYSFP